MKRPPFDPTRAIGGLFDPIPKSDASKAAASEPATPREDARVVPLSGSEAMPTRESRAGAESGEARKELTVTAFSDLIARTLEQGMRGSFRIVGELTNFSDRKHWYFSVKDAGAVLSCVLWSSDTARCAYRPREGDAVVVTGRIGHYAPQGRTQLYATRIEQQGIGSLEAELKRLVAELRALGYFEEARKKPLPPLPRRVAVVTSATGAALQDVLKTAAQRCPAVEFVVVDVKVQGDGAAAEVARALRALDRRAVELGLDAVIVTRGGGSREDLWAFNERVVADAAFAMSLPLVAAIGHEVDTSIIELIADRRASTPTQAVMLLLPDLGELREQSARAARDLANAMRWQFARRRERLAQLADRPALASPNLRIARARARVASLASRLREDALSRLADERRALELLRARVVAVAPAARAAAARARLASLSPRLSRALEGRQRERRVAVEHLGQRLRTAGPEATIRRGYAVVTDATGTLVRSATGARPGDALLVRVADGVIDTTVVRARATSTRNDESARPTD